jgi:hypothetical protein
MNQYRRWIVAVPAAAFGLIAATVAAGSPGPAESAPPDQVVWNFDNLNRIGGNTTEVVGHPHIIDSPGGKAIEFNGVDDGIIVNVHPLAGAATYSYEAIFRPDGGEAEQRWLNMNQNPAEGTQLENRMLFELRVVNGQWCLDAFNKGGAAQAALLFRNKLYPLGQWYHVAAVYDGKELRSWINGELQGAREVKLEPQGEGRTSVGMRIQKVYFFKGAVARARFTRHALQPSEFMKLPGK